MMQRENYTLTTLKNGLRALTLNMPGRESISVAVWVGVGSRYESGAQSGISHCLEHMVFKGTAKRSSRDIRQSIEGIGGVLNAFTGEESTCYFVKLLPQHLKTGLDVLADIVFNARLDAKELEKEKAVIIEEIKMYKDLPSHEVQEIMSHLLWPDQALGRPIAGSANTVSGISQKALTSFRNSYYQNPNIVVSVAGDIQHPAFLEAVENTFNSKTKFEKSGFPKVVISNDTPKVSIQTKQTEQTHLVLGMRTFSRFHPDRYKLALLNVILGANMSSRLFEEVREKKGLAYEIRSGAGFYHDCGYLSVNAGVENKKALEAVRVILGEFAKFSKKSVSESELTRAKDFFLSQLLMALEDSLDHLLWAGERVIDANLLPDRQKIQESIKKVTPHDIMEVSRKIFSNDNLHLAMIGPVTDQVQEALKKEF